jgi:hypothetical protein
MTHPPCKIELERARWDWVATRVAVILVGFAASGYLSTAFVRIEAVPLKPVALIRDPGLYRESVTNGEHRRVENYDVSTLDAQFAKKVTASRGSSSRGHWRPHFIHSIYRKKVENG